MERRAFLSSVAAVTLAPRGGEAARAPGDAGRVLTVTGRVEPGALGITLVHEHVLVDFIGADRISPERYDREEVVRVVLPQLGALRERGCRTLVEATPAYLGRDPVLLRRLSEASGILLVTNTGYYGFGGGKHLPAHAFEEAARQLADRWTREFRRGIEGTGIRPGFIKVGVHAGSLSEIDRKLVEAGALCHLDTGLTLAVHTGDGEAALDILETLRRVRVSPRAWIWVHAQNETDRATHDWAARQGAWVEFDGVGWGPLDGHLDAVVDMKRRGWLDRVLVSQDAGWYHVGEPRGGEYRPHTVLFDEFVPGLRARGLGEEDIRTLLVDNPARAFAVGVRHVEEGIRS
jgi:phosphotriesterase-related protein